MRVAGTQTKEGAQLAIETITGPQIATMAGTPTGMSQVAVRDHLAGKPAPCARQDEEMMMAG